MKETFRHFFRLEAAGGLCLMGAAALALLLVNSPLGAGYQAFWHLPAGMLTLGGWVNDGFMAIFFLLVGLELKREFAGGTLGQPQQAMLPFMAALGGMIAPCGIFYFINHGDAAHLAGWAIPAATDIAFALGVLALLGRRVPASVKLFLTALAIIDDLGAILIIGLFYTAAVSWMALVMGAAIVGGLWVLNRRGVAALWPYLLGGAALWLALHESGLHATLAGVLTAFLIPSARGGQFEHCLHPWVAFGILPVFALANAGLDLGATPLSTLAGPLPLGIALGLLIGKPLGILAGTWLALHLNWAALPPAMTARQLLGVSILGGIGFTMSLFIGDLAFGDAALAGHVRLGVLAGSLLSALLGYAVLRRA